MKGLQKLRLLAAAQGDPGAVGQMHRILGDGAHVQQIDHVALVGGAELLGRQQGGDILEGDAAGEDAGIQVEGEAVAGDLGVAQLLHLEHMGNAVDGEGEAIAVEGVFHRVQRFGQRLQSQRL